MSNYPCTHQAYPNPEYPNHKPLRGNYPGSYTSSPSTPVQQTSSRFDWLAAGVGAAGMLGLILLLTAVKSGARIARSRKHDVPRSSRSTTIQALAEPIRSRSGALR